MGDPGAWVHPVGDTFNGNEISNLFCFGGSSILGPAPAKRRTIVEDLLGVSVGFVPNTLSGLLLNFDPTTLVTKVWTDTGFFSDITIFTTISGLK